MDGSRRRVSRIRRGSNTINEGGISPTTTLPSSREEEKRKKKKYQNHLNDSSTTSNNNSASVISKLKEKLSRSLMRGLFDESDSESSSNEKETAATEDKELKAREERRRSAFGQFIDDPQTSEDLLATEGGDFGASGGTHIPFLYPHHKKGEPRRNFELIEGNGEEQKKSVRFRLLIKLYLFFCFIVKLFIIAVSVLCMYYCVKLN